MKKPLFDELLLYLSRARMLERLVLGYSSRMLGSSSRFQLLDY